MEFITLAKQFPEKINDQKTLDDIIYKNKK